jgi:hypothetical protein
MFVAAASRLTTLTQFGILPKTCPVSGPSAPIVMLVGPIITIRMMGRITGTNATENLPRCGYGGFSVGNRRPAGRQSGHRDGAHAGRACRRDASGGGVACRVNEEHFMCRMPTRRDRHCNARRLGRPCFSPHAVRHIHANAAIANETAGGIEYRFAAYLQILQRAIVILATVDKIEKRPSGCNVSCQ